MAQRDWQAWHDAYDVPGSGLARRLEVVQAGAHQFSGEPQPLAAGQRMFSFVGYDVLRHGAGRGLANG
jgi:hypothetical protein